MARVARKAGDRPLTVGAADDQMRERVNWGLVVALLACLSFWGAVMLGLAVAFVVAV